MNQNPESNILLKQNTDHTPQAEFYLSALRLKYATQETVLARLDIIADKIKKVPLSVQYTVTELLRVDLESRVINTSIMTAAIMAINPKNAILDVRQSGMNRGNATNDEKYELAA